MRAQGIAVVLMLSLFTAAVASPPPYTDADILALELSNSLLAPASMVSQISADLVAIRSAYPGWVDGVEYILAGPNWVPGVILVQMTPEGWTDYQNGVFTAFNDLNAQYGPLTIQPVALARTVSLEFTSLYHPVLLSSIYAQTTGIAFAQPNYFGGDGSDITTSQVGSYTFKRGWGDCSSGCSYAHFWEFEVTDGNVVLVDEYGDPTLTGVGDTPAPPAAVLTGSVPNPFDRATDVAYRVASATHVQLRVYDVSGRLVKNLRNGPAAPGAYAANWDGTDEAGRHVASGVYFCSLVADGVAQTRKMLLIR